MTNADHLAILKQGVQAWNAWRRTQNSPIEFYGINLEGADLSGFDLRNADFSRAILHQTSLEGADLTGANLFQAELIEAELASAVIRNANLSGADLSAADLTNVDFTGSDLDAADLSWSRLLDTKLIDTDLTLARLRSPEFRGVNLSKSILDGTLFADVNLSSAIGLATCVHRGPSIIDHITLQVSGELPKQFLTGIGLQEALILALPQIRTSLEHYSCFISYSSKDEKFASQIHKDLTRARIKCWFAPHDMPIGGKVLDEIDGAISKRDKVLLILSEASLASEWVEDEVTKAFAEERRRNTKILFPIRLDDAVELSQEPWAAKLRVRHIGDFRRWTVRKWYKEGFQRVLRDLMRQPEQDATSAPALKTETDEGASS
ncbi:toll/interleukin-1 receptor domain-containing protein [Bradyrhizobium sp. AT1]|uniref:toll/interleukin-1 receptor domain-containing protein n=1 Tax=Bradyrhizobium sp. AT1 TaxID=574934 RepID=UPI0007ABD5DF|nr:toll/interleukin-1 receptor domain-containing protein [Bradyrhizobium sp. AT1]